MNETVKNLMTFLDNSPSQFHAVANMAARLRAEGYTELKECECWNCEPGGKYYVTRNGSAIIAVQIPEQEFAGFQIMASHSDSPVFKIKANAEMKVENKYIKLNVERYGGMLFAPWFDRPLSVAGRVTVKDSGGITVKLIHVDRDLLMIPNLAVHMNRDVNDGYKYNAQKDMLPLFGGAAAEGGFMKLVAAAAGVGTEDILDTDLFLYNRMKAVRYGLNEEFIGSARLDDLQCAFASLEGFLQAEPKAGMAVHCVLDNEEVGSGTKQGAASTFLKDVLMRINAVLGRSDEQFRTALCSSFMVSADNAHGVHPNQTEKTDPTNRPYLNDGIVIKYSANQRYTTDAVSGALFKQYCEMAGVPYQTFLNRSDMLGGSTLGNISNTQVALNTVDVGLPQLAMHSPYETAGVRDTEYLIRAAKQLFSTVVRARGDGMWQIIG